MTMIVLFSKLTNWVQLVLLEDLSGDVRDCVRGHTGVPVRWKLLLLEEVAHLGWVGSSKITAAGEEFAGWEVSQVRPESHDVDTH